MKLTAALGAFKWCLENDATIFCNYGKITVEVFHDDISTLFQSIETSDLTAAVEDVQRRMREAGVTSGVERIGLEGGE